MIMWFDKSLERYCVQGANEIDARSLVELRWEFSPQGYWSTTSPYYATPFWNSIQAHDTFTQQKLGPFAWKYQTSFAKDPLAGTGVDVLQTKQGAPDLFNFQIAGIQLICPRPRVIIGDAMGLGKSAQFINVANLKKPKRVLISCPAFLVYNWAAELEKWCSYKASITMLNRPNKNIPDEGFILLPYSRAFSYWAKLIASGPFDLVGLDEIHYLKGHGAQRVKPYFGYQDELGSYPGVVHYAKQVIGMSGTVISNNPSDAYNPIVALAPEIMGQMTRTQFIENYCTTYEFKGEDIVDGGKHEAALNVELRASGLLVRRLKKDVLTQLPPKNKFIVHLSPTKKVESLVREELELYEMAKLKIFTAEELQEIVGHIATVRKNIAIEKAPKIGEYALDVLNSGENRAIVFMWHTEAINQVAEYLTSHGITTHVIDGRANLYLRQSAVEDFQSDNPKPQIFLGQIKAAGVGLTLTKASQVIMGETSWVPSDNEQAEDRAHRISQDKQVDIHVLAYPHSVESQVMASAAKKEIVNAEIMDKNLLEMLDKQF